MLGALTLMAVGCGGAQHGPTAPMRAMRTVGGPVEDKPYAGAGANAAAAAALQVATGCSLQGCLPGYACDKQSGLCKKETGKPQVIPAGLPGGATTPTDAEADPSRCLGPVRDGVCPSDHVKAPEAP